MEKDSALTPAQKKKAYYEKNKAIIRAKQKAHYDTQKAVICKQKKEYYKKNSERIKKRVAIQQKDYYKKPGVKQHRAARDRKRYATDIDFKMANRMRSRMAALLGGRDKSKGTKALLGCSMENFKAWIEFQFDDDMTWDNHGDHWHLDHIKPCAKFKLSRAKDQEECFHWSNLQPLEATENLEKSDTYTKKTKENAECMLILFKMNKKMDTIIKDISELKIAGDSKRGT